MRNEKMPWVNENGELLSTEELREISKSWNEEIWESYLVTLEVGIQGLQLSTKSFDRKCQNLKSPIWDLSSENASDDLKERVASTFSELTEKQHLVIKKYFFDGLSEREIAQQLNKSPSTIHELKEKALDQIKQHLDLKPSDLTIMRGQENQKPDRFDQIEKAYWDNSLSDSEFYRLWALIETGQMKSEDL